MKCFEMNDLFSFFDCFSTTSSVEGVEKHVKNFKTTRFLARYGGLQKKNYWKIRKI